MAALHPSNPYFALARSYDTLNLRDPFSGPAHNEQVHATPRSASITLPTPSAPPTQSSADRQPRKASTSSQQPRTLVTYRTRSFGGPFGGVYFERAIDISPPNDDEIIIVTARVTNSFRRASIEENSELPERPRKRSFLKRVSTRVSSPTDSCRYTALKMPRRDYKKYFARDREGGYAGTEPEREWTNEDLQRVFGEYQDMPLRSIPGGQEFGEGVPTQGDEGPAVSGAEVTTEPEGISGSDQAANGELDQMRAWGGFGHGSGGRQDALI